MISKSALILVALAVGLAGACSSPGATGGGAESCSAASRDANISCGDLTWSEVLHDPRLCSASNDFKQYFVADCGGYHVLLTMQDAAGFCYYDVASDALIEPTCPGFTAPDCAHAQWMKLADWCPDAGATPAAS